MHVLIRVFLFVKFFCPWSGIFSLLFSFRISDPDFSIAAREFLLASSQWRFSPEARRLFLFSRYFCQNWNLFIFPHFFLQGTQEIRHKTVNNNSTKKFKKSIRKCVVVLWLNRINQIWMPQNSRDQLIFVPWRQKSQAILTFLYWIADVWFISSQTNLFFRSLLSTFNTILVWISKRSRQISVTKQKINQSTLRSRVNQCLQPSLLRWTTLLTIQQPYAWSYGATWCRHRKFVQ